MIRSIAISMLFCFCAFGSTNVQHVQQFTTGTNNALVSTSVLAAGRIGLGTWDYSGTPDVDFHLWKIGTNTVFTLPNVFSIGGTNITQNSTNWVYFSPQTYGSGNYERMQYTVPGVNGGANSNLWAAFPFMSTITNGTGDVNFDFGQIDGQLGSNSFCVAQLQTRLGGGLFLNAHSGTTNGIGIPLERGALVWVTIARIPTTGACDCEAYNITNGFARMTNASGAFGSHGSFLNAFISTNSYRFWLQANYLMIDGFNVTGTNWVGSPIIGYGNDALPPVPDPVAVAAFPSRPGRMWFP